MGMAIRQLETRRAEEPDQINVSDFEFVSKFVIRFSNSRVDPVAKLVRAKIPSCSARHRARLGIPAGQAVRGGSRAFAESNRAVRSDRNTNQQYCHRKKSLFR